MKQRAGNTVRARFFWLWYTYKESGWQLGMTGADIWSLKDGDIVAWEYTNEFPF